MNKTILTLLLLVTLAGCKKNDPKPTFNGTYSGKFTFGTDKKNSTTKDAEVNFSNNNYSSTLGSGTFTVQKNKVISFTDKNYYTADFDWNMILNYNYTYEIKGDSLILTKKFDPVTDPERTLMANMFYQYRLKKVN